MRKPVRMKSCLIQEQSIGLPWVEAQALHLDSEERGEWLATAKLGRRQNRKDHPWLRYLGPEVGWEWSKHFEWLCPKEQGIQMLMSFQQTLKNFQTRVAMQSAERLKRPYLPRTDPWKHSLGEAGRVEALEEELVAEAVVEGEPLLVQQQSH